MNLEIGVGHYQEWDAKNWIPLVVMWMTKKLSQTKGLAFLYY